jgi:hypothetical protein
MILLSDQSSHYQTNMKQFVDKGDPPLFNHLLLSSYGRAVDLGARNLGARKRSWIYNISANAAEDQVQILNPINNALCLAGCTFS